MGNKYREAMERLNAQQRKAVKQLDGPVLVIAGPGTGKTQLLTTRIAHILETTDTSPRNILCLTFTESAVSAMRQRLSNLIGKTAYDVSISTYHAFGNDLIRRWPDYFMDFSERQALDDLGIDSIMRELIADLPYGNPLKFADRYIHDLRTLISDAKRAALLPEDVRTVARANLQFIGQAGPIVEKHLGGMARMSKTSLPLFVALHSELEQLTSPITSDKVLPLQHLAIESLSEALQEAQTIGNQKPLTAWKDQWLDKNAGNQLTMGGKHREQRLLAAADLYERYTEELAARERYDYEDMILEAIKALQANDEFRYSLQERYLHILLDEFQDTNGAQFQLVELLTNNPVNEGRPDVLAVGDDDQAIYAFQGADYSNMLQFQQMYRDVLPVPLTENYRSQAPILHTARGIAEQIEQRLHHRFPGIEKTLSAKAPTTSKTVVERVEAQSDVEQFGWVAERIVQLAKDGVPLGGIAVLAPQHRYLEPLVAFLQQAQVPVHYEKRENILDDPAITELLSMSELVLALAKGDKEAASTLWPQILSFGFWGLATSQIWQLSWQAHDKREDWTAMLLEGELRPIALFFIRLAQICESESLGMILDQLIGSRPIDLQEPDVPDAYTSPFYDYYFGAALARLSSGDQTQLPIDEPDPRFGTFWQLLTHLTILRARLAEYRTEEAILRLPDLLEFIRAHRAADIKIINTSPYETDGQAVQLMTAFKSKGQEFDVVFVLACNDDVWSAGARGQGTRLALPPNLQFIRYAGATDDERLRLLYVAMTRAKSQLYLLNYTATYSGKTTSRLRYLDESVDEQGAVRSPLLPDGAQTVLPAHSNLSAPVAAELGAYWQARHYHALSQATMTKLIHARLRSYQLSPTDLGQFTDLEHAGPEAFLLYNLLHFPRATTPELHYGNAIHNTLQWVHLYNRKQHELPSVEACFKKFAAFLETRQLVPETLEHLLKRGRPVLKVYLEQRAGTIAAGNECEYSFREEGIFIGEAHMSGKIDKLIIDRENKTLAIVDYKTGGSHQKWQRSVKLHKYRQQLYLYKLLAERSHSFSGYQVTDAYVEFVEPDEEGIIQELHLHFDEHEEKQLEQLTEKVWHCIQSLELPNTAEFRPDIGGIEAFEASLIGGS